MALGGGNFTSMNKPLPGAYINNVSAAKNLDLVGVNGIVAIAIDHDYGNKGDLIKIKAEDFSMECKHILGYDLWDEKLKGIRELVENSTEVYFYILNDNKKASNDFAEALKGGTRGDSLAIKIQTNVNNETKKDIYTLLDNLVVDKQTVKSLDELSDNKYVSFKKEAELKDTAKSSLLGGENGTVKVEDHQAFLNRIETLSFNILACLTLDKELQQLYVEFTKRMREDVGLKFSTVLKRIKGLDENIYDHEGIIAVENDILDKGAKGNELVYFTSAISASTELGKSNLNRLYTGEYKVNTNYTQAQLIEMINEGKFVYHSVGEDVRILKDINGLVTFTDKKGKEFRENQTIRILDALAIADANAFNSMYLGKVNIDKAGMESFQTKVLQIRDEFLQRGAFLDYSKETVKVEKVEGTRGAVKVTSGITPAECFEQLYATNIVRG